MTGKELSDFCWSVASSLAVRTNRRAEEYVAVACIAILSKLHKYDPNRGPFAPWAFKVAYRAVREAIYRDGSTITISAKTQHEREKAGKFVPSVGPLLVDNMDKDPALQSRYDGRREREEVEGLLRWLETQGPETVETAQLLARGYQQRQIGQMRGVSRQAIFYQAQRIRKAYYA